MRENRAAFFAEVRQIRIWLADYDPGYMASCRFGQHRCRPKDTSLLLRIKLHKLRLGFPEYDNETKAMLAFERVGKLHALAFLEKCDSVYFAPRDELVDIAIENGIKLARITDMKHHTRAYSLKYHVRDYLHKIRQAGFRV